MHYFHLIAEQYERQMHGGGSWNKTLECHLISDQTHKHLLWNYEIPGSLLAINNGKGGNIDRVPDLTELKVYLDS